MGPDVEVETAILGPPDAKRWLIWEDPNAGKDWGQEEKGTTEDEMFGWHHRLNGHGFGWTLAVGDGQGGLVCCGSWGHKESDTTEWLNWTELMGPDAMILGFLSQLSHSPLSPSSRGSLVPLCFLLFKWYHLHIWGCWYFSWKSWFQLVSHPAWHFSWCALCIS